MKEMNPNRVNIESLDQATIEQMVRLVGVEHGISESKIQDEMMFETYVYLCQSLKIIDSQYLKTLIFQGLMHSMNRVFTLLSINEVLRSERDGALERVDEIGGFISDPAFDMFDEIGLRLYLPDEGDTDIDLVEEWRNDETGQCITFRIDHYVYSEFPMTADEVQAVAKRCMELGWC